MKKNKGFTLVELLVVIAIIGLLATLAVVTYADYQKGSRDSKRYNDIGQVRKAMEQFFVQNERYPNVTDDALKFDCDYACNPSEYNADDSYDNLFVSDVLSNYVDPSIKFLDPINDATTYYYRYTGNRTLCANTLSYGTFLIVRQMEKKQTDQGNYDPDKDPYKDFCNGNPVIEIALNTLLDRGAYVYLFTWPKK